MRKGWRGSCVERLVAHRGTLDALFHDRVPRGHVKQISSIQSQHLDVSERDRRGRVDELRVLEDEVFAPDAARPHEAPAATAQALAQDV